VEAIVEAIDARLRARRVRPDHVEGEDDARWVLMDYLDFVIHVFTADRRDFYGLEQLWADAPRLAVAPAGAASRRSPR
jgi:ribosome-associated protein